MIASCAGKKCPHKDGPAWSPVDIPEGKRGNANVRAVTALVIDVDDLPPADLPALEVINSLDTAGISCAIHTTHRHRADNYCLRLAFELSRPVLLEEYKKFRIAALAFLRLPQAKAGGSDPKTNDPSRLFFLPSAPRDSKFAFAAAYTGAALDVDRVLASYKPTPLPATSSAVFFPEHEVEVEVETDVNHLREIIKKLARKVKTETRLAFERILKKQPLAEKGARGSTLNAVMFCLAQNVALSVPFDALAPILRPSLVKMIDPIEDVYTIDSALAEAEEQLQRGRVRRVEEEEQRAERLRAQRETVTPLRDAATDAASRPALRDAATDAASRPALRDSATDAASRPALVDFTDGKPFDGSEARSQEDGLTDTSIHNPAPEHTIIYTGRTYRVWRGGEYKSGVDKEALDMAAERWLAPTLGNAIYSQDSGKMLPIKVLLKQFCTPALREKLSLIEQEDSFDPVSETLVKAVAPLARLTPKEHPEIQTWLELFGANEKEKLLDWVASVTKLDQQCSALAISGVSGAGKTLLSNGLARLWGKNSPADLRGILTSQFNANILVCPLLLADESLPKGDNITANLRELIGSKSRSINAKFEQPKDLEGAVRIIIAGNNDHLLKNNEDLGPDDIDAISQRILWIHPSREARTYLESLGGEQVDRWITQSMLAEHALWLRDTRAVKGNGRFLVAGSYSENHEQLSYSSGISEDIMEWNAKHLIADKNQGTGGDELVQIGEGEYWVSSRAVSSEKKWQLHISSDRKPPRPQQAATSLRNNSVGYIQATVRGQRLRFFKMDIPKLLNWIERAQLGDREELLGKLARPNEAIRRHNGEKSNHIDVDNNGSGENPSGQVATAKIIPISNTGGSRRSETHPQPNQSTDCEITPVRGSANGVGAHDLGGSSGYNGE